VSAAGAQPLNDPKGHREPGSPHRATVPPKITPLHELQLVERHRRGDPGAITELLQAYQRRIYGVCRRMMGEDDSARDMTQEALVKVLEGLDSYDGRSKLSTWIIRVAMNCCLTELRRRTVRRRHDRPAPPATGEAGALGRGPETGSWRSASGEPRGGELPPARSVEQAETTATLLRALARLDPDMRCILVLRDLQDLDYQQIGAVLDIPVGTVKSRLFRARLALRSALESMGID
jgi:RNA polymerase sigma-70 factor (ECF subfamily)